MPNKCGSSTGYDVVLHISGYAICSIIVAVFNVVDCPIYVDNIYDLLIQVAGYIYFKLYDDNLY